MRRSETAATGDGAAPSIRCLVLTRTWDAKVPPTFQSRPTAAADAGHDFVSYFVGAAGAADEELVDVEFVGEKFFAAFAHGLEMFPESLEQLFLEVAVTGAAFLKLSCMSATSSFVPNKEKR